MPSRVATSASDRPSPFSCAAFCICGVSVMLTPFTIDRTAGSGTNPTPAISHQELRAAGRLGSLPPAQVTSIGCADRLSPELGPGANLATV